VPQIIELLVCILYLFKYTTFLRYGIGGVSGTAKHTHRLEKFATGHILNTATAAETDAYANMHLGVIRREMSYLLAKPEKPFSQVMLNATG
jgi:hypothetical protein